MANKIENLLVVYNTRSGNGKSMELARKLQESRKYPFNINTKDARELSDNLRKNDLSDFKDMQTVMFSVGDGTLASIADLTARASLHSGNSISEVPPFLIFPSGGVSAVARSANHFPEGRLNQEEVADNLLSNLAEDIETEKLVVKNVPLGMVYNGSELQSQFWYTTLGNRFSAPILNGIEKHRLDKKGWLRQVFGAMYSAPEMLKLPRNEITVRFSGQKRSASEATLVNPYFPRWAYTSTDDENKDKNKILLLAENNPQMHPLLIAYGVTLESFEQNLARIRGKEPAKRHNKVVTIYPLETNEKVVFKSKAGERGYIVDSNVYETNRDIHKLEITPQIKSLSIPVYFARDLAEKRFR